MQAENMVGRARWPVRPLTIRGMLVVLLLAVLVPVLVTQLLLYREQARGRWRQEEQANLEVARALAAAFRGYAQDVLRHELATGTGILASGGRPSLVRRWLAVGAAGQQAVRSYAWVDASGKVITASAAEGGTGLVQAALPRDLGSREWHLSDLQWQAASPSVYFTISRVIRDEQGRRQGAVVAVVDPNLLGEVLAVKRLGQGAVSVYDRRNRMVYRYPQVPLSWQQRGSRRQEPVLQALHGREAAGTWQSRVEGSMRVGAAVPVPELGWVVAASRPVSQVMAATRRAAMQDAITLVLVTAAALLVAMGLASRIAEPLSSLRRQAAALAKGQDPGPQVQRGPGEVQEVSAAFTRMAQEIQARERQRNEDLQAIVNAQLALAESEQRYRAIGELLPYGIWITDREGRAEYFSDSFLGLTGRSLEACRGWGWLDLLPPEQREQTARDWAECVARGGDWDYEYRIRGADGHYRTVLSRGVALRDERGEIVSWVGVNLDITQRKRAEDERARLLEEVAEASRRASALARQLEQEREILATIMDNTQTHLAYLDADLRFVAVNTAYQQGCGHPREELLGRNHFALFPNAENEAIFRQVVESGQPVQFEAKPFVFPDQPERGITYWDWTLVPVADGAGKVRGLVFSLHDVTDRIRAREELERERAFLSSAIELLPFPIFFVDAQGKVIRSNLSAAAGGREGTRWSDLELYDPYTKQLVPPSRHPLQQALQGKLATGQEWLARSPQGKPTPVLVHAAPVYVGEQVVAAVVALQDISVLKEADQAKNEFLAVLSHELLTPITSVIGWTQWALKDNDPETMQEALQVVARNAVRQKHLVDDLLDVSRILHGKFPLHTQPAQLSLLLAQSVETYRPLAAERELSLELAECDPALPVLVDPIRLQQAIGNLLGNAIKYTPPGGRVTVSARRQGKQALLEVQDTGRGLAPDDLEHVLEPFRQVQRDEAVGGLGLGLALARGIVELHGGHLGVSSPGPGRGSTFTVTLPLQPNQHDSRLP